jgi:hypothetical protein
MLEFVNQKQTESGQVKTNYQTFRRWAIRLVDERNSRAKGIDEKAWSSVSNMTVDASASNFSPAETGLTPAPASMRSIGQITAAQKSTQETSSETGSSNFSRSIFESIAPVPGLEEVTNKPPEENMGSALSPDLEAKLARSEERRRRQLIAEGRELPPVKGRN